MMKLKYTCNIYTSIIIDISMYTLNIYQYVQQVYICYIIIFVCYMLYMYINSYYYHNTINASKFVCTDVYVYYIYSSFNYILYTSTDPQSI